MKMNSGKSMRKEITRFTSRESLRPVSAWIRALNWISTPRSPRDLPARMAWPSNNSAANSAARVSKRLRPPGYARRLAEGVNMSSYVFIESRDPFESRDIQFVVETAMALRQSGHAVTVFLAQNGVLAARWNASGSPLPRLAQAGVQLLADNFSLRERGIMK